MIERFPEDTIFFFPTGRNCLVHSSQMNPCEYSIATIKGKGWCDQDIIRSFGAMIWRRSNQLKEQTDNLDKRKWPYSPRRSLDTSWEWSYATIIQYNLYKVACYHQNKLCWVCRNQIGKIGNHDFGQWPLIGKAS